ncbi:MAG: DUF6089 family protein [Saprospiraceae bacterium]|jgi:hypothetical protein|nr:DUF6089 family protein [Saprospiraceae bacterium]
MTTFKKLLAKLLLLSMPIFGYSQNFWEVSLSPGALTYLGDLTVPHLTFKETHFGGQINIKRYFNGEHALRLNILHGTISGDDRNFGSNAGRGNNFKGQLTEFSLMGEIDLKGRRRFSKKLGYQKTTSPYINIGLAGIYCNPTVHYGEPNSKDQGVQFPDWHFAIPVGGGVKFDLTERIVLGVEMSFHVTLSDYLDGTQASGNAYKNDSLLFSGLTIGYRFEKQKKATVTSGA